MAGGGSLRDRSRAAVALGGVGPARQSRGRLAVQEARASASRTSEAGRSSARRAARRSSAAGTEVRARRGRGSRPPAPRHEASRRRAAARQDSAAGMRRRRSRGAAAGTAAARRRIAAQLGSPNDSQDRLEPGDDRLPLRKVGLRLRVGQVEHRQALLDAADIGLGFAQDADEGQLQAARPGLEHFGGARAGVEPHADRRDLAAAARDARQRHHLGEAVGGRFAVEDRIADRHQDDVGEGDDTRQVEAAQAAGRVEDDVADARRRPQHPLGSTAQPTIGALRGRSRRLRERSHDCVDCWRSTSPSITGTPQFAKCAARWVASVLLPLPPLRLTTAMTDMTGRFGPILHGHRPGQNVTAGPERGKGTVVFSIRAGDGRRQSAEKGRPDRPLRRFARPGMSARDGLFSDEAGVRRCAWCAASPAYRDYHDREWGFPVDDDRRLFEKLCLEGFQAGLSWLTILSKREAFRARVRRLRRRARRALRRARRRAAARRRRHRPPSRQDRVDDQQRARACSSCAREFGSLAAYVWRFEPAPARGRSGSRAAALLARGRSAEVDGAVQGPEAARLDLRRPDHGLRLHAGDGAGQRSPRRLRRARRGAAARGERDAGAA